MEFDSHTVHKLQTTISLYTVLREKSVLCAWSNLANEAATTCMDDILTYSHTRRAAALLKCPTCPE